MGEQEVSEARCELHGEKLKFFCFDHQQPVCVVCQHAKTHVGHTIRPVDEAAQDRRDELRRSLKPAEAKLELLRKVKGQLDQTADHIQNQAQSTEKLIRDRFKTLHDFLREEEEARVAALREEEKKKRRAMNEKTEALSRDMSALSDMIRATEQQLRAEDLSFLQNYTAAVERVRQRPLPADPQLASGALIDVAQHLGNLTYNVWSRMKEMVSYSPVILDPNTAYRQLAVSDDLTSVTFGDVQQLPDNPERTAMCPRVLASACLGSGTHIWDCEVINDRFWAVGVLEESVPRRKHMSGGYWELCLSNGKYTAASPPLPNKVLSVNPPRRIRVRLDFDKGELSFHDPETNTHIHTFTHTFTGKLLPYVATANEQPLTIVSAPVSAGVEQQTNV